MIFMTVGSQKFPFDRLVKAVDGLTEMLAGEIEVFGQIGSTAYEPAYMSYRHFIDRDEFERRMTAADVVITHAGTGAIVGALKRGKKVIAVPRLVKYGEHVDDHQVEIVKEFSRLNLIEPCYEITGLRTSYEAVISHKYDPYKSNSEKFIDDLRREIKTIGDLK